ncbi:PIN domain-containing protein [Streptomyces prunicolor]|uniref:PIN domain-containing protein n=1 Tax=Streptomyces prunicolor TaxID=67348 RepID=UPI0003617528|nr:PIN domain-containing protein [Streptomyces prunicolor]
MLITPRPGTDRQNLLDALRTVHTAAVNERGGGHSSAYRRLLRYLEWALRSAQQLRNQVSAEDLTALVLTKRHDTLLDGVGHLAGTEQQRVVNLLVDQELAERAEMLEATIDLLRSLMIRWEGPEWFVVADSSFYIQNADKLKDADLHQVLGLPSGEHIRLLFPITVVDELDALKEAGKHRPRWRAGHTLGLLDGTLNGSLSGVLRRAGLSQGEVRGQVSLEIVLDPPGHVRLPLPDDEIVDRAVAIQSLAGRPVRLLTCDTSQHTRGKAVGLHVTKVPAKDPGPEPDWETQDTPGNGTRAKRRERQATSATTHQVDASVD